MDVAGARARRRSNQTIGRRRAAMTAGSLLLLLPLLAGVSGQGLSSAARCPPPCKCARDTESSLRAQCSEMRSFPRLDPAVKRLELVCSGEPPPCGRTPIPSRRPAPFPRAWLQQMPNLSHVSIDGCAFRELPAFVFANLSQLLVLHLRGLSLARLDASALHNSYNLRQLVLAEMPCLEKADSTLLMGMARLHTVKLVQTSLTGIQAKFLLQPVRATLRRLVWTRNELPVTIPINSFLGFKLKELDLSFNRLTDFDFLLHARARRLALEGNINVPSSPPFDFSRCRRLRFTRYLNLRSTNLRRLEPRAMAVFSKLQTLLVGKNFLRVVSGQLFRRMRRLRDLDLSNNQLQTLPQDMEFLLRRKDFTLALENNPLHCNCELAWLLKYPRVIRHLSCSSGVSPRLAQKSLVDLRLVDLTCKRPQQPVIDLERFAHAAAANASKGDYYAAMYSDLKEKRQLKKDGKVTLDVGESLILRCRSSGDPPPEMMWHIVNGSSVQRWPSDDHLERFNEIEWRFSQADLHFDRYVILCRARSAAGVGSLKVIVYNKAPKAVLPARPRPATPAAPAAPVPAEVEGMAVASVTNGSSVVYDHQRTGNGAVVFRPGAYAGPVALLTAALLLQGHC